MANSCVLTAAQTETILDNATENPTSNAKRQAVHVTLVYDGVTYDPALLLDALQNLGTIASERNYPSRGNFVFNVGP